MLRALPSHRRSLSDRPVRRSTTKILSYREDSDSDDSRPRFRPRVTANQDEDHLTSPTRTPTKPPPSKVTRSSSVRAKRTLFSKLSHFSNDNSPSKKRKQIEEPILESVNIERIPRWQTLPFEALVDIFHQAAPIAAQKPTTDATKEVRWLLGVSRLCRAFFEPAITVLYNRPPLSSHWKIPALVHMLEDDGPLFIDYARKIHELDISAGLPQTRYADLLRLVGLLPALKRFRIYDPTEYGQPRKAFSHSVLQDLLSRLDSKNCRLQFWEWNKRQVPDSIETFHLRPSFEHLRSLRLYNLDFEDFTNLEASDDIPPKTLSEEMAVAVSRLRYLRVLDFTNCEIPGCALLLSLPEYLNSLSFTRCDHLTSESIERFLVTHGSRLRRLVLSNNRELDMSFTANLRGSCPELEVFKMDLNFSSPTLFAYDVEPHFDHLFSESKTPDWPASLRVLHLERLRKWDGEAARRFFDNLLLSAPRLMSLRTLIITAIVDVNWRERAELRKEYVQGLERTFFKRTTQFDDVKIKQLDFHAHEREPTPSPMTRRSTRLARKEVDNDRVGTDTDKASDAVFPVDSGSTFVQGLCDTVIIRIDNLRPADVLLTADSFQDEEPSDDEDWEGEDIDLDDGYAW